MPSADPPLAGRTIVVTRAAEQGHVLRSRLEALGATVIELPLIRIERSDHERAAVAGALALAHGAAAGGPVWLVVTSPNGAAAVVDALDGASLPPAVRIGAVGLATYERLAPVRHGVTGTVHPGDVVAVSALAESLLDSLGTEQPGFAVLVQADRARPVLADGLRARGWSLATVVGYRTVAAAPDPDLFVTACRADAITFASGSAAVSFAAALRAARARIDEPRCPPVVVSMGPVTTAAATDAGLAVTATADPHTIDGLVAALCTELVGPRR